MGTFGRSFRRKLLINIYELCKFVANLWASAKYILRWLPSRRRAPRWQWGHGTQLGAAQCEPQHGQPQKGAKNPVDRKVGNPFKENIGDTESDILCVIAVRESWKIWMLISRICLKKPVMTFMESMHASLWRQVYPPTNVTSQILRLGPQRCTGPWDWDVSWSSVFSWMFSWLIWLLLSLISIHIIWAI